MHITASAVSLNVPDVAASADFARTHLGFSEKMSADGFVSLNHPDAGFELALLRVGLSSFKPERIAGPAGQGLLLAFVVDDVDAEFARIAAAGAQVVTPPETEPWGERYCQFADPNGIVWQLVQWV
ncbi:VOC family protein [Cellulomonas dongxiuzhuiae]|uniref:VOC family protein n=1 Tax=Cellulomonas dongxiuzhuiae TaxID=2819979 RepID=A0ABX8GHA2_9CELL|nr:VOC family protein [Cellulomonas dongxiuzhuiae]MBO3086849.1 VOC family protein [Cellulomonas dongxiuzhuiae]MBO3093799.1 VOC family protein [Cellulomonas dongxiuzhuiae]QWC14901.1 VOC family protein [Cellulomonas dongxiuzhuiae]